MDIVVRRSAMINVSCKRRDRGRPKKTLIGTINKDLNTLNLSKHMIF